MKKWIIVAFLLTLSVPTFAKTHKTPFATTCATLWPAVKDVLKSNGKYMIIGIDSQEMTASFAVGSVWSGKAINSVVLTPQGAGCELAVNTAYRGITHNDADDLKKRIDESLAKQLAVTGATPAVKPDAATTQPVKPQSPTM